MDLKDADEVLDYLFYVLPNLHSDSRLPGGLCWLEVVEEPVTNPSELRSNPPKFCTKPPSHETLDIVSERLIPFLQAPSQDTGRPKVESSWHIVWNPAAGQRRAKVWLDELVLPLLNFAGVPYELHETSLSGSNDVKENNLYKRIFSQVESTPQLVPKAVILGGDGTIHDFLNQVISYDLVSGKPIVPSFELVILPFGTANALFFSSHPSAIELSQPRNVLASLLLALSTINSSTKSLAKPLSLAQVKTYDREQKLIDRAIACVVVSTALHASILHTADELRENLEFKGSARFKEAFSRNNTKLWDASVKLFPLHNSGDTDSSSPVLCYDREAAKMIPMTDAPEKLMIEGGFSYFTACLVDRLEAGFLIAPMRSASASGRDGCLDVNIVRPRRDNRLKNLVGEALGKASATQITEVMVAAYQSGSHLQLTLEDGQSTVEYVRCDGWIWTPTSIGQEICIDGKLIPIPVDGSAECTVVSDVTDHVILW